MITKTIHLARAGFEWSDLTYVVKKEVKLCTECKLTKAYIDRQNCTICCRLALRMLVLCILMVPDSDQDSNSGETDGSAFDITMSEQSLFELQVVWLLQTEHSVS